MLDTYGHMRVRLGDWMQQDAGDRSGAGAEVTGHRLEVDIEVTQELDLSEGWHAES